MPTKVPSHLTWVDISVLTPVSVIDDKRMAPKSASMKTLRATRKNVLARGIQLKEASDTAA
ncbi:uncharacterized protein DS421_13g411810 [Arachis hypogaea]|nr:uncharacterized protein DS421_13g411810 [Arachis hypogaea]